MFRAAQIAACVLLASAVGGANAHDLFVSFAEGATAKGHGTAIVSNGTFHESAGAVKRERLKDVALHQAGKKTKPDLSTCRLGWMTASKIV